MRMVASWQQYLATTDAEGVRIHQYATAEIAAETAGGAVRLAMRTDYPWDGRVVVDVLETSPEPWALSLRVPAWAVEATVRDGDGEAFRPQPGGAWSSGRRTWQAGARVTLELDLRPRVTRADPRIDAVRGCVALERGPLVYCIETADLPAGVDVEAVRLEPDVVPVPVARPDIQAGLVGLDVAAVRRRFVESAWPYDDAVEHGAGGDALEVRAIPYFAWANRSVQAMRVFIPVRGEELDGRQ